MANTKNFKFNNLDDIADKINQFKDYCDSNNRVYTIERLLCYLKCDRQTLLNYLNYTDNDIEQLYIDKKIDSIEIFDLLKEIYRLCNADLNEKSLHGEISFVPAIFNMKNNFGYVDKQEVAQDLTVSVSLGDDLDKLAE